MNNSLHYKCKVLDFLANPSSVKMKKFTIRNDKNNIMQESVSKAKGTF